MQRTDFRPKYTFKSLSDVLLISFGLLFASLFSFWRLGLDFATLSAVFFLFCFCFWWMHNLVRHIVFTASALHITWYFLPPKTINYIDIIDVGFSKIRTKRGYIKLAGMSNAMELLNQVSDLIKQGVLDQNQIEMKLMLEEAIDQKSTLPALIISFPLWGMLFYFWPYHHYWFSPIGTAVSCGIIFFIVISIVRQVVKMRAAI
jgi:hypothetical protein